MKRVFLIVLDSVGIGYAPDAERFGDVGANTLRSCWETGKLNIPNLTRLGISDIEGVDYLKKSDTPTAIRARLAELSLGKDTTTGHWEIAGLYSDTPMPTYPNGFPNSLISEFERRVGRAVICNKPYSGTDVIRDYGEEHMKSGALIVYTSADSVFQIAAHEDIVPLDLLYSYCEIVRELLIGEHAVGRVIARPFVTENGEFKRSAYRRDFSLKPKKPTMLDAISDAGLSVISVGKIYDIFAGVGVTESHKTHSNAEGMEKTIELTSCDFEGLAFINLVDFDSSFGHRQNAVGYAEALSEFDTYLEKLLPSLSPDDALIITADHGCDPSDSHTDHTREYVPLLIYGRDITPMNAGTLTGFGTIAGIVTDMLGIKFTPDTCDTFDSIRECYSKK